MTSLTVADTGRISENRRFERGQNLLQNGILNFVFRLSNCVLKLEIRQVKNTPFEKL